MSGGERTYIHSRNMLQMCKQEFCSNEDLKWQDFYKISNYIIRNSCWLNQGKSSSAWKKMNSSCYCALGVCERGKEEMERQIFSWINVEDIPYPNDSSKRNLNSFCIKTKAQPLEIPWNLRFRILIVVCSLFFFFFSFC